MNLWNERDRVQKVVSCSQGGVGEGKRSLKKRTRLNALTVPRMEPVMDHRVGKCAKKPLKRRSIWKQNINSRKEFITGESSYHHCFFLLLHIVDNT